MLLCERGLVAVPLTQRLEDLRYRIAAISKPDALVADAEDERPLIVLADFETARDAVATAVEHLRANPPTAHIPVVGFAREVDDATQAALVARGATMVVSDAAILSHLGQLLSRALEVQ
jgi:CheY-like chemotaxis protein